jgi:hypothetical protein
LVAHNTTVSSFSAFTLIIFSEGKTSWIISICHFQNIFQHRNIKFYPECSLSQREQPGDIVYTASSGLLKHSLNKRSIKIY